MQSSDSVEVLPFSAAEHYAMICTWWEGHKWPRIPLESLPETGIIVAVNDTPVCAVWLYKTDSNLCWMEWMISNPNSPKPHRTIALPLLIDVCIGLAKEQGFRVVFTSIRNNRLLKRLVEAGFTVNDVGATNLTRVL